MLQRGNRPVSLPKIFLPFFFFFPPSSLPPPVGYGSAHPPPSSLILSKCSTHPPTHPATHPHPQHCFSSAFCIILHLLSLPLFCSLSSTLHAGGLSLPPGGEGGGAATNLHNNVTDSAWARAAGGLDLSPHVNGSCIILCAPCTVKCFCCRTTQLTHEITPLSLTDAQKNQQTKT